MCQTNSSTLICGVPTSQYLNSSDKSMKVTFHPECKGRLFAAIAGSGHNQTILDIGNGDAPLTEEIDGFLQVCWETSHMDVGLWDFSATWLGLVVGLAEASVQFRTNELSDEIVDGWLAEPTEAYSWLKDQMRKFQRRRPEISDIASDVPTFSEDMSVRQRALIGDKIHAIEVVNPSAILPNLENWHIRHATHPDWEDLIRRQNLIQLQLAAKEDGDPEIEAICGQSTARFYLESDSSTEDLAWCLPCRTAAVSIIAAAFKRDQHLSISEPLPSNIEGAVANRLGMMTLSKHFRDAFMPRLRAMIRDEVKRMTQKGGVIKTNNGLKLCDDLANDRVSQWMKVAMEESAAQSRAVVPQAAAHKPEGLTDRHLRIAEKISTLDETSEGDEEWMPKWGVQPQSWPQFWRSFKKASKAWNVVLSEASVDLNLRGLTGFGFVDYDQNEDFDVQDESDTNGVTEQRETEENHEFAVSPGPSIGHAPIVQYDSELEDQAPPPSVYRGTNPSTRKTRSRMRSTTPGANIQRPEARKTSETSPQDIPLALRHSRGAGDPTLDRRSFYLTDAVIEFEAPQKPNIAPVAPRIHEAHLDETVAPRTMHGSAKIPRTVLGCHDQSHEQRRGLSARSPRTEVPSYEATQRRTSTFIAPVQAQEPYRHDRLSPRPPVEAQTPEASAATRAQTVPFLKGLMFAKPMEALQKARREAKASGRSRFG
ncbi:hypothetical protein CEP54_013625 [Fusarium duplospermum]|uniref:Uncharacterized protein n=1 Tax=Fusarium duplospermum TaxID=1325734 RepID=A0A428P1Q3_9HYPO|nr:hypothetical protein CEP54_013625 [Fusarium duplospermum]